jgi:Arc/MetJ-type ribon-helix-helix transcriptional regulator
MGTRTVTVKLVDAELQALDELVTFGWFDTRSGALRAAIGRLFVEMKLKSSVDLLIESQRTKHRPRGRTARRIGATAQPKYFAGKF